MQGFILRLTAQQRPFRPCRSGKSDFEVDTDRRVFLVRLLSSVHAECLQVHGCLEVK
jgi:hypothetical protein